MKRDRITKDKPKSFPLTSLGTLAQTPVTIQDLHRYFTRQMTDILNNLSILTSKI